MLQFYIAENHWEESLFVFFFLNVIAEKPTDFKICRTNVWQETRDISAAGYFIVFEKV